MTISDYDVLKYMLSLNLYYFDIIILQLKFSLHSISTREEIKMILL